MYRMGGVVHIISDNLQKESEILYMKNKSFEIRHICIKETRKEEEK